MIKYTLENPPPKWAIKAKDLNDYLYMKPKPLGYMIRTDSRGREYIEYYYHPRWGKN